MRGRCAGLAIALALLLAGCELRMRLGQWPDAGGGDDDTWRPDLSGCLSAAPAFVDLGVVASGSAANTTVTIRNVCDDPVVVETVEIAGNPGFRLEDPESSAELGPGESREVRIAYAAEEDGAAYGELVVAVEPTDAGAEEDPQEVALVALQANTGAPCLELIAPTFHFGCLPVGTSATRVVTVRSCGDAFLTLTGIALDPASSPAFALQEGLEGGLPIIVGAGQTFAIPVEYRPLAEYEMAGDGLPVWDRATLVVDGVGLESDRSVALQGIGGPDPCHAIEVRLTWSTRGDPEPKDTGPGAGADLDLHLRHELAVGWFDLPFDAHWLNASPDWGVIDQTLDDPLLSVDDVDGQGPEVAYLDFPEPGRRYRIGVHYWSANEFGPSMAQVQVWLWGRRVHESPIVELIERDLWEAVEIDWLTLDASDLTDPNGLPVIHHGYEPICVSGGCNPK